MNKTKTIFLFSFLCLFLSLVFSVILYKSEIYENSIERLFNKNIEAHLELPKIRVMLKDSNVNNLNLLISCSFHSKKDRIKVKNNIYVAQNMINSFLSEVRMQDIQQNEIAMEISMQIKKRLNALYPNAVKEVYIKEIFLDNQDY